MDLSQKVEYTEEGFRKLVDSLTFIDESKRNSIANMLVNIMVIE